MADRYAVATGAWASTTVWSATSGGAPGASAPVNGDNAILDAASGAITVTLGGNAACTTLNCTGFTGTLELSTRTLTVNGNVTLSSGMILTVATSSAGITVGAASTITGGGIASVSGTTIITASTATINASGTTFANLRVTSGAKTITLGADLAATILDLSQNFAATTFAGAYNITAGTLRLGYYTGLIITFVSGQTVTVTTAFEVVSPAFSKCTLKSSTTSSPFYLVYTGPLSAAIVVNLICTDVDASRGARIDNWYGGTLTRCVNIVNRTSADLVRPPRTRTLKGRQ